EWAREAEVPGAVVQHDVLTPFAPPLPPDTTLLSWTAEDGEFHRAERDDIEVRVVGSQRLWQARHDAAGQEPVRDGQPVFLGQLSSIELPRRVSLRAAHSYCRFADALYQPGPGEDDRLARAAHLLLRRRGIALQDPSTRCPRRPGRSPPCSAPTSSRPRCAASPPGCTPPARPAGSPSSGSATACAAPGRSRPRPRSSARTSRRV